MNKLLLLALLGFALIAVSGKKKLRICFVKNTFNVGAKEETDQDLMEVQHIAIREVQEAGRKNKRGKSRNSRKQKRNKKAKQSKKKAGKKASKRKAVLKKRQNAESQARASTCLDISCIDTAVGYMKLLKGKVANFGKQSARITKQNKTGSKNLTSVTKYFYKLLQIVSLGRMESLDQL